MQTSTHKAAKPKSQADLAGKRLLKRSCECGTHTVAGADCAECGKKKISFLQESTNKNATVASLPSDSLPISRKLTRASRVPQKLPLFSRRSTAVPAQSVAGASQLQVNRNSVAPRNEVSPSTHRSRIDFSNVPISLAPTRRSKSLDPADASKRIGEDLNQSVGQSPAALIPVGTQMGAAPSAAGGDETHEVEADRVAADVVQRLDSPQGRSAGVTRQMIQAPASGMAGLSNGRPLSANVRQSFERAFGWDFSGVRIHSGSAATNAANRLGARAFTLGRDIVFGREVRNPESSSHRRLLAHELAHVVQQDMGAGAPPSRRLMTLSPMSRPAAQAAPLVTNVATSAGELGVGGRDITATATVGGRRTPLTWTINPGGVAPAGVRVIGAGRRVRIRADQPGGGAVVGGAPITIRAEVTGTPGDNSDSPAVNLIQVVSATYAAAPGFVPVSGVGPPPNSADPNRDGIAGNTAAVNAVTAPVGRPIRVAFRRRLGANVGGTVVTPGRRTGDIGLRITDTATRARLDETLPSAAGGAALMADLVVNAVPTRVRALANLGALGPYGVLNNVNFNPSDNQHLPLIRTVGELITHIRDDFNLAPPNGAFNAAFNPVLAVPANTWNDQLTTPFGVLNVGDGLPGIDINRFAGPGVPGLPRRLIYRQRFQYASWQGVAVVSRTFADGRHIRSLVGTAAAPQFRTEHRFGAVAAPPRNEPYLGNPLIVLTAINAVPTAAGATGLAADGVATANLTVGSSVAGRTVNWAMRSGDAAITAGNPAVLPAPATLTAGVRTGNFRARAADTVFPNRRVDGRVRVVPVRLSNIIAQRRVPRGVLSAILTIDAEPGGRTLNWVLDAASIAAGVVFTGPAVTGPGRLGMQVTITRPAGVRRTVTVTASDSVLPARRRSIRIRFL